MAIDINFALPELGLSTKDRLLLYRQLKRMLRISPLKQALQEIARRARESRSGTKRAKACDLLLQGLEVNKSIGESLLSFAPSSECTILTIGQNHGRLNESLESLIFILESQSGIVGSLIKAVLYPTVLILITIGMHVGFNSYMVPLIETVSSPEKWTDTTVQVIEISKFIANYWYVIIGVLISISVMIFHSFPRWTSNFRDKLDQYPLYGTYRDIQSASFILALSSAQKAGASIDESLKQIRTLSTPWLKRHLDTMIWKLSKVDSASDALDVGLIPRDLMADIKIATMTGDLDEALSELGHEAIKEFKSKVEILTGIIGPVGLLIVAINIMLIGLAYYGAIMPTS